jgi:hypothetical protein
MVSSSTTVIASTQDTIWLTALIALMDGHATMILAVIRSQSNMCPIELKMHTFCFIEKPNDF